MIIHIDPEVQGVLQWDGDVQEYGTYEMMMNKMLLMDLWESNDGLALFYKL